MTASVSPELIEKWRSEFEQYHGAHARFDNGRYVDNVDQTLWVCWFKSRQSAVIELPKPTECCGTSRHYWPIPLKDHIEAQGYRVKVKGNET